MPKNLTALVAGLVMLATAPDAAAQHASSSILFYTHPAREWNQALPLGNGRLGAMVFGNVAGERIQLNENTLWMGGPRDTNNPDALKHLAEVRRLLFAGMPVEAYAVAEKYSMGQPFRLEDELPAGLDRKSQKTAATDLIMRRIAAQLDERHRGAYAEQAT